jgi:hypothetical protein
LPLFSKDRVETRPKATDRAANAVTANSTSPTTFQPSVTYSKRTPRHSRPPDTRARAPDGDEATRSADRVRSIRQAQTQMLAVIDRLVQQLGDVVVVEAVDDAAAGAGAGDQPEVAQQP